MHFEDCRSARGNVVIAKPKDDANALLNAAALLDKKREQQFKDALKEKDRQIELLEQRVEALRKPRWSIPLSRRKNAKSGRPFVRVIIPDTHGCMIDPEPIGALLNDIEALNPKEIILLGDHLECGGFLAQHWTLGYVAQTEYTFEQDVDAANDLFDKLQKVAPNADYHYLEGNHERRVESWCVTQALKNRMEASFLLKHFAVEVQLHLEKRGIPIYKQGRCYMGLSVPATIKLGHCYFTHGHTSAKHAAHVMLDRYGGNVVFGHIHRAQEASSSVVSHGTIKAWCPGCLCQRQPMWRHTDPSNWTTGYGVQIVQDDQSQFLHNQIPIINGRSLLMGMMERKGL